MRTLFMQCALFVCIVGLYQNCAMQPKRTPDSVSQSDSSDKYDPSNFFGRAGAMGISRAF